MDTSVYGQPGQLERQGWKLPEAALRRLRLRLGRGAATGEAWDASLMYGVPWDTLSELVEYWLDGFAFERGARLDTPCFKTELVGGVWSFTHVRSPQPRAVPLLMLHGYSGSPWEHERVVEPLTRPRAHGADAQRAFHVVCPGLPGFGLSQGRPHAIAQNCAALMQRLGYTRYLVHGSDLGANLALALGACDGAHVLGLHLTALPTYPAETAEQMAQLSQPEKSQLARLTELHDEQSFHLPESAIEGLAFSLAAFDDPGTPEILKFRDALLSGLSCSWALGSAPERNALYRALRLKPAPATSLPVAVQQFPLDAPSLRRFAERAHHVVQWCEHERGGPLPGLEQPDTLLQSLRDFANVLRA